MVVSRRDTTALLSAESSIYLQLALQFINQILPRSQSFNLGVQCKIQSQSLRCHWVSCQLLKLPDQTPGEGQEVRRHLRDGQKDLALDRLFVSVTAIIGQTW